MRLDVKDVDGQADSAMLVALGFDGTISNEELTIRLGEQKGRADEIAGLADRTVSDGDGHSKNMRQRVGLLEGLREEQMNTALGDVHLRDGARS